jgi:hypothetical protein
LSVSIAASISSCVCAGAPSIVFGTWIRSSTARCGRAALRLSTLEHCELYRRAHDVGGRQGACT